MASINNFPNAQSLKRSANKEKCFYVFQLNCNGIKNKLAEIKMYIYSRKPEVFCLCETYVKKFEPKFQGYQSFWKHRDGRGGGLGTFVRRDLAARVKPVATLSNSQLEIQCTQVHTGPHCIDIINIYNPQKHITHDEMTHYSAQLSAHSIIIGDFNAHSPIWDGRGRSNATGKSLEAFLTNSCFGLLNDCHTPTYIDHKNNTTSCLDLCFVTRFLLRVGTLSRGPDVGSDHFPIECKFNWNIAKDMERTITRWKYTSADWKSYKTCLEKELPQSMPSDATTLNTSVSKAVFGAANQTIGRTSGKKTLRRHFSGWDLECNRKVSQRRQCRQNLWKNPTPQNLLIYNRTRAECRYLIKKKKEESFASFVNTIDCNTPSKTIWNKIKSINGNLNLSVTHLGNPTLDPISRANSFLNHYTRFKKPKSDPDTDRLIKEIEKSNSLVIPPVTTSEVITSIQKLKNTSPGRDEISNQLLKKLPLCTLNILVDLFNTSLTSGCVPQEWKTGITVPILKPGKDPHCVKSCRPITMLSCIGKLMERVIQGRLERYIEQHNKLSKYQMGFRRGHSTIEALALIYSEIKNSFQSKSFTITVYLDLQSAFDSIWYDGLLIKMSQIGVPNYILKWFTSYFQNRKISVRLGTEYSTEGDLVVGVPQGAVLSPLLFNVMLHDLPTDPYVKVISYADDITLVSSDKNITIARNNIQSYLNKLTVWLNKFKLNINPQKSTYQVFTTKRIIPNITLRLMSHNLHPATEQRILGIIFDAPKLTFGAHFKYLNIECKKRINVLRALSSTKWGCSRVLLRRIYIAYIRSKMEYGAPLFTNIKESYYKKLDVIQNDAIRCILGARKTSPILSLQVESVLPPIAVRFRWLFMKWFIRVSSTPILSDTLSLGGEHEVWSFGETARNISQQIHHKQTRCKVTPLYSNVSTWEDLSSRIALTLPHDHLHDASINHTYTKYLSENFPNYKHIYTDGSKLQDGSTSAAVYLPEKKITFTYKLNPSHSVLGSELYAILKALQHISSEDNPKYVILSDSQSALSVISNTDRPPFRSVTIMIQDIMNSHPHIKLQWTKSHCGILGNEIADQAANLGHCNNRSEMTFLSIEEQYNLIDKLFIQHWNQSWKCEVTSSGKGTHLSNLQDVIRDNSWIKLKSRKLETSVTRMRLGHVGLNKHLHRFEMHDSPLCEHCLIPETIEHFILYCPEHRIPRRNLQQTYSDHAWSLNLKNVLCFENNPVPVLQKQLDALATYMAETGRVAYF